MYPEASTKTLLPSEKVMFPRRMTNEFRWSLFIVGRNVLLFAVFPFMWGFMVTRGVKWGKSLGPEVFLCVG